MHHLPVYAKAIVAFVTSLLGGMAIIITGPEGFSDVLVSEWIALASSVAVTTTAVFAVPNGEVGG